jgi:AraC-like DNA-binding protein
MRLNLQTLSNKPLLWKNTLPSHFKGIRLPGGKISSAQGEFGSVCLQEIREKEFSIQYNVFDATEPLQVMEQLQEKGMFTRLILKGELFLDINDSGAKHFRTNHLIFIHTFPSTIFCSIRENTCITFDTFFTHSMVAELLKDFPGLQKLLNKNQKQAVYTTWADISAYDIVYSILRSKYKKDFQRLFYENRIWDLLFKYLVLSSGHKPGFRNPGEKETQAIFESVKVIEADLTKHIVIPVLARMANLSPTYYKQFFKQIMGVSPYDYLLKLRMKQAKEMLQQGYSVKEIAINFGYRPSDFSTLFRQQTGFNPSAIKKRAGPDKPEE